MLLEKYQNILRPDMDHIHMGVMKVDHEKCNKCGLCMQNCPLRAWELDEGSFPAMKKEYECISCYNCKVACPNDAIIIVESYHVTEGYWKTDSYPLPAKMPLEAKDENGNPTEWNAIEKAIFERRSVRNFKDKPVPENLIQRVLEAGRFAPSGGNCQPWKFIVITNKALIKEIEKGVISILKVFYTAYKNDKMVQNLVPLIEGPPFLPGSVDPRAILGGTGSFVKHKEELSVTLNAAVLILLLGDERAISGPELNIGICGQNMNLVANSLGIKACWNGFVGGILNTLPLLKKKLGIKPPWKICNSLSMGYPAFRQEGIVPREYRPVTWFKEGSEVPEIQK